MEVSGARTFAERICECTAKCGAIRSPKWRKSSPKARVLVTNWSPSGAILGTRLLTGSGNFQLSGTCLAIVGCGLRSITADMALRLARYFGNSAQFWLDLQSPFDISMV